MMKLRLRSKTHEALVISPDESLVDPAPKLAGIRSGRTTARHAQVGRASAVRQFDARKTLTKMQKRLVDGSQAPVIPKVADMLVRRESLWTWCARAARTPAFGIGVIAYLVGAWAIVGVVAYTHQEQRPTAQQFGFDPQTGRWTVPDTPLAPVRPGAPNVYVPEGPGSHVDPDYLSRVDQMFGQVGAPTSDDSDTRPEDPLYPLLGAESDSPAPSGPAPTPSDTAPSLPPAVPDPNGATATDIVPSPPAVPDPNASTATGIVPLPPAVANPNGPPVGAPTSETPVPAPAIVQAPATAPASATATDTPASVAPPPTVATPSGPPAETVSPQPVGPAPGPAA